MGNPRAGHLSLLERAKAAEEPVVADIIVNQPLQQEMLQILPARGFMSTGWADRPFFTTLFHGFPHTVKVCAVVKRDSV